MFVLANCADPGEMQHYAAFHLGFHCLQKYLFIGFLVAQWLSGRVLDSRQRGRGFKPHQHHCVMFLEQDTFILA